MGGASKNKFLAQDIEVNSLIVNTSTSTTNITVVTAITTSKTTEFDFNTQTIYLNQGILTDFGASSTSTVTTSTS